MEDERALRRELDALSKKREQLDSSHHNSPRDGPIASSGARSNRKSVLDRIGGTGRNGDAASPLREHNAQRNDRRQVERPGNLGKRGSDRNENQTKRQRLHSAVAKPVSDDENGDGNKTMQQKKRAVAPYTAKEGVARSRRMFGALMGHLGKAKQQIEKDTDLFKRQGSKHQEAEQKEKLQSKALEVQAKRNASIGKYERLIAATEVDMQEQVARLKLTHLQLTRKSASLARFIQTVASPPLYYLPVKHTKETEDLVAASKEAHEEKLQASTRDHQSQLRSLEAEFASKIENYRELLEEAKKSEDEKAKTGEEKKQQVEEHQPEPKDEEEDASMSVDETKQHEANAAEKENDTQPSSPAEEEKPTKSQEEDDKKEEEIASEKEDESMHETDDSTSKKEHPASSVEKTEQEEPEQQEEDAAAAVSPVTTKPAAVSPETKPASVAAKPTLNVSKLRVPELREQLKQRGLDTKGLKSELVQRLEDALAAEEA